MSAENAEQKPLRKMLRSRIEKQLRLQQEEQRRELMKKRIEIAKEGVKLYQAGKTLDALKKYQQYLVILEMWKKCGRDNVTPDLFDKKKDIYELVLISGIFWDLAKLYDMAKRLDQREELALVLQKFVLFSKGFPYQPLSAEACRRYLGSGKVKHREEFRKAYVALTGEKCFIATSLIDVTEYETLTRLRRFRDNRLAQTIGGRLFISAYYSVSPKWIPILDRSPHFFRSALGRVLDRFSKSVSVNKSA